MAWSPILSAEVARIATFFPLMIMWHVWIACVSGGVGCAGVRRSGRGGEVHARFILPLFRLQTQSAAVADSFELNLFLSNLPRYRKERTKHHNSTLRPNLHTALHALAALRPHPQPPLPSTRNCTALTAAAPTPRHHPRHAGGTPAPPRHAAPLRHHPTGKMSRGLLTLVLCLSARCDALVHSAKIMLPRRPGVDRAIFPPDMSYNDAQDGKAHAKRQAGGYVSAAAAAASWRAPSHLRAAADDFAAAAAAVAAPEGALLDLCASVFDDKLARPGVLRAAAIEQAIDKLETAARAAYDGTFQPAPLATAGLEGEWRLVFTSSKLTFEGGEERQGERGYGMSGVAALPFCSSVAVLQRLGSNPRTAGSNPWTAGSNPRAQCIEIVELPLPRFSSFRNSRVAVVFKGDWEIVGRNWHEAIGTTGTCMDGLRVTTTYASAELTYAAETPTTTLPETLPPAISEQLITTMATHIGSRARVERAANGDVYVWERQATPIEQTVQMLLQ